MITGDFEGSFLRALVEGSGQLPYTATVQSPLEIPPTKTFDFFLVSMKKKQTNLSSILPSSSLFLSHYFHFPFPREKKKKKNSTIHDSITRYSTSQFRSRWIVKKERGKRKAFEFRILSFSLFIVLSILKLRKRIRTDFVRRAHVKMAIASVPVATLAEVSAAIDSGDISRGTIASDDVDNSRSEANESVNWTTSSGPPISGPLHGASLFSLSV